MEEQAPQEVDFDTPIPVDTGKREFEILPDDTVCNFIIKKMEQDRSKAGNLMAKVELIATAEDGRKTYIYENVVLSHGSMFRVRAFGLSIGHLTPGEPGTIDWSQVATAYGQCTVKVEDFDGRDGEKHYNNKIKEWLSAYEEADAPAEQDQAQGEEGPSFG